MIGQMATECQQITFEISLLGVFVAPLFCWLKVKRNILVNVSLPVETHVYEQYVIMCFWTVGVVSKHLEDIQLYKLLELDINVLYF